jgi:hypothetical protein
MRIRQIVFAARDLANGSALLSGILGLDPPFRDPGVGAFGLDNAVYVFGDQFIEIVSPVRAGTTAGRLMERRGDSGYMLIVQTDDLKRDRARFKQLGVRTVLDIEHDDISAVHLHPKDIGGAIVSVDEPRPMASWRWGGPDWRSQAGRRGEQRVVGLTVEANDPEAMARRWAAILGLAAPASVDGLFQIAMTGAVVDFVTAGSRGEGISGYTLKVADASAVRAAARAAGLPVGGDRISLFGVDVTLKSL